jgi:large subunit ribosomal protein L15
MMGQKARSGGGPYRTFEGGQTRLVKRMPFKRGFTNIYRIEFETVNVGAFAELPAGTEITPATLLEARVVRRKRLPVKILGDGELNVALTVHAHKFSASARSKIEAAGGTAVELPLDSFKVRRSRSRGFNGGGPKQK